MSEQVPASDSPGPVPDPVPPDVLDLADRLWRGEISTERHHPVAHLGGLAEITEGVAFVPSFANVTAFDTEDGHQVFVAVTSDAQWERFCRAFDRPELLADARLRTNQDRADANPWLVPLLADLLRGFARDEVFARCRQAAVPCAPVARVEDLYADPHIVGGGGLLETLLPGGGTASLPRLPVELDRVKPGLRRQAPRLGEHTREILCAAGFAQDAIATLAQRGLIAVDVE